MKHIDTSKAKEAVINGALNINKELNKAGNSVKETAIDIKENGIDVKKVGNDIKEKTIKSAAKAKIGIEEAKKAREVRTLLDDELTEAIDKYNTANEVLNGNITDLFEQRQQSANTIVQVEGLINSIANTPKSIDKDINTIKNEWIDFKDKCDYAAQELKEAQKAAVNGGAGVAAGVGVVALAPSAAMAIATTFGTASTGAAISTLSGAAATNAALAWLGGGALAAGGGGVAGGSALLALAGPVGWGIAGSAIITTGVLFIRNRSKLQEEKKEEIKSVIKNTEAVKESNAKVLNLNDKTSELDIRLKEQMKESMKLYASDYSTLSETEQHALGALVNNTLLLSHLICEEIK